MRSQELSLQGTVIAVASDTGHNFSKPTKTQITMIAGYGVEGDVHAGQYIQHRYLNRNKPQLPNNRQVHLKLVNYSMKCRWQGSRSWRVNSEKTSRPNA